MATTPSSGLDDLSVALTFTCAATLARAGAPLDARGAWFTQPTLDKTVALTMLVRSMQDATSRYRFDPATAVSIMTAADARLRADAAAIGDPSLAPEVALSAAMLELMIAGAPQGVLPTQE